MKQTKSDLAGSRPAASASSILAGAKARSPYLAGLRHAGIAIFIALVLSSPQAQADIVNWQTGQTVPGRAGIVPGPSIDLSNWNSAGHNLRCADLSGGLNLTSARFLNRWLDAARFNGSNLARARFDDAVIPGGAFANASLVDATFLAANLNGADFHIAAVSNVQMNGALLTIANFSGWVGYLSTVAGADFTDANIYAADFSKTSVGGFTKEQLYSTATYKSGSLAHVQLNYDDVRGWQFSTISMPGASFNFSTIVNTDFRQSDLRRAKFFYATLTNPKFQQVRLADTNIESATIVGAGPVWPAAASRRLDALVGCRGNGKGLSRGESPRAPTGAALPEMHFVGHFPDPEVQGTGSTRKNRGEFTACCIQAGRDDKIANILSRGWVSGSIPKSVQRLGDDPCQVDENAIGHCDPRAGADVFRRLALNQAHNAGHIGNKIVLVRPVPARATDADLHDLAFAVARAE